MPDKQTKDKAIVLVHGGFVDGSGWKGVYDILKKDGYDVSVVQNPTISLQGDVKASRAVIDNQGKPVILVGHSYGGAVITEAGNDPNVKGLVFIAAFAPDKGEAVSTLLKPAPGVPSAFDAILPPQDGFLLLDKQKFRGSFAGDVDPQEAAFIADSQVPWNLDCLNGIIANPAWRNKQSWYLLTTEDHMIPPDVQRSMSKRMGAKVTEVSGSHAVYVSKPEEVARIIETAAQSVPQVVPA